MPALSPHDSSAAGLFSFCLVDGVPVRLRLPHVRETEAGSGLVRLATAFVNNPGSKDGVQKKTTDTANPGSWGHENRSVFLLYRSAMCVVEPV